MSPPELERINGFLSAFARRQAARVVDLPGGFAALDDAFAHSHADNQVVIDGAVDPEALPALAERALGHLPFRLISVLDDDVALACAEPLGRAGYTHSTLLVMLHTGPVPTDCGTDGGSVREVDLDVLRVPLARSWRGFLPDADDEVVRHLVDRREARRRGADVVRFLAARTREGEVAAWADLYVDPASGTAQIEDLVTSQAHLRRGHGDAVLRAALRTAADEGCGTRFLIADAADWPHHWYERRGFRVIGRSHCFERS
jgi:GNAT superfamily N-acetyltransferase